MTYSVLFKLVIDVYRYRRIRQKFRGLFDVKIHYVFPLLYYSLIHSSSSSATQSALTTASDQANQIAILWWAMFIVAAIIFSITMGLISVGIWRGKTNGRKPLNATQSTYLVLAAGVVVPLATVLVLVGGSLTLGKNISATPPENAINIRVTGWMWWWEIEYYDDSGEVIATTANELHVPVGRAVNLELVSGDVIHSFWVPELHGKTDMIPGKVNTSWFTPTKPGEFRGQCAEFCGVQHALMAFWVIAKPEDDFQAWLSNQRKTAAKPINAAQQRGQNAFLSSSCAACHQVRGTSALGKAGPDLTHLASRKSLAAATRPNNRGHLGGWIIDPQSIKPGNKMPATRLTPQELSDLIDYLESLH